jgi:ppGpp synthetase/RelA/SpoT-type nucleotidyltranferase
VSSQFYTRARGKTTESIVGKIRHVRSTPGTPDRPGRPDYSFRDITDYAGFRIVTLYDDQLLGAIDHIIDIVRAGQNLPEPLFAKGSIWDSFHDGVFNARTSGSFNPATPRENQKDIYYKCLAYLFESVDKYYSEYKSTPDYPAASRSSDDVKSACVPRPRRGDRYSSAHLTFWANSYQDSATQQIPVEFQIRTAVEDVWGEINHKLLYKSKNPYVWSVDYETSFRQATELSERLKNTIDELPKEIARFHNSSTRAQLIAEDFWGGKEKAPKWQERKDNNHLSLCAGLLAMAGDGTVGKLINDAFRTYEGMIRSISGRVSTGDAAATLAKSINHLKHLSETIDRRGSTDEIEEEHRNQRIKLLELEVTRLQALMCTFGYAYKNEAAVKIVPMAPNDYSIQIEIYKRLCEFLADPKLRVKPITMLHVWKYLLSRTFSPPLAEINLSAAYEALNVDPTLPYWSIYRVMVPYLRGELLLKQAHELYDSIQKEGDVVPPTFGLQSELSERLDTAFRLAIDAFDEHTDPKKAEVESRGDVGFSRESYTPILQANLAMAVVIAFKKQVGKNICERNQMIADQINRVYDYVKKDLSKLDHDESQSETAGVRPEIRTAIEGNFQELKKLLKRP